MSITKDSIYYEAHKEMVVPSFGELIDVHRGWCNYCKGKADWCMNCPKGGCALRDCIIEFRDCSKLLAENAKLKALLGEAVRELESVRGFLRQIHHEIGRHYGPGPHCTCGETGVSSLCVSGEIESSELLQRLKAVHSEGVEGG